MAVIFVQWLLLLCFLLLRTIYGFNIDTANPIYRFGQRNTYFGFSIAQHFVYEDPVLIVGAPRAESGQPGTLKSGAVFACRLNFSSASTSLFNGDNCNQLQIEYPTNAEFNKPPQRLNSKILHNEGKNHQLLGFVVQSTGLKYGNAMVCAPLLRYGQNAYTDGACYLLNMELNHTGVISTCNPLPKKDRHNDYGACEQGFSGYIDKNVILTGLPGARKWTGGVFGRYEFISNGFPDTVDRWTMEVNKNQNGVINILASHDYLGYSVGYGRFGFWYEELDRSNFTIVSGATRYQQFGAVIFLPFRKNSHPEEERLLGLNDNFTIIGQQLGSGFGAAIQVLDLNNDGFDDLIVSAPYEYYYDEDIEFGGAVYVIYSAGISQNRKGNDKVFMEPIVLRGKGAHSQFGISLTKLGNLDNDFYGYQDFAVGASQADDGQGAVFIYHGAERKSFVVVPAQEIYASSLINSFNTNHNFLTKKKNHKTKKGIALKNFGSSLAGGVDMDGNNYNELAVGAFESDAVIIFRTKPVVDIVLSHAFLQQYIKIDDRRFSSCPSNARTCFSLTTKISTLNRNNTAKLLNFDEDPFICHLEVIPYIKIVGARAIFVERNKSLTSWACGRKSLHYPHEHIHKVYVPQNNQDWTHPLRFKFTVTMRERRSTELVPAFNKINSEHIFDLSFDKKCGDDNDCHADLVISAILLNITRRDDGVYVTKVTERDVIVIRFVIENKKERAFFAKFFIEYDQNELDEPRKIQHKSIIDIEQKADGLAIITLGNPFEEGKKLTFDLSFNLVRGSSERVSASLSFKAHVNSTSIEDEPSNNDWQAEVQLIKEADLQLNGASVPLVVRFSKGNPTAKDEEDIGQEVVHVYTLTNHGPFYAKNVSVTIHWPLKLNTERHAEDWALYTLEEPIIRHNGEIRKCRTVDEKAINPLNIYNDETLRLTYEPTFKHLRKPKNIPEVEKERNYLAEENGNNQEDEDYSIFDLFLRKRKLGVNNEMQSKIASIFDGQFIKPKEIKETSGSLVRIVDVNCKDQSALCVPIVCNFDYVGTNDAALIEIRARLWNYTFSGDYKLIEYFAITSDGYVEVDEAQGIIENIHNNFVKVITHVYPDRPLQDDRVDIWILLLAALAGFLLLSILVLVCWKCGFFKRKRNHDLTLHQANRLNELEQWH